MIQSFKDKSTAAVFMGHVVKGLPREIQPLALRKLKMIDSSAKVTDLLVPPGNRLEALKRDRKGQHSIRINDQWRVCFRFADGNAFDVEIVDYHLRGEKMGIDRNQLEGLDVGDVATGERLSPIHPGEILREEFLVPLGMTGHALAIALQVPAPRINDIVRERRAVTADTALRLAKYFGTSVEFWVGLQADFDVAVARAAMVDVLARIVCREAESA
jgi:antitoxin HigA-1